MAKTKTKKTKGTKKAKGPCGWMQITIDCRRPTSDGENLPGDCDPNCPALIMRQQEAAIRAQENTQIYQ